MPLLAPVRAQFRALALTILPDAAALGEAGWAELEAIVDEALADRPAGIRRQLLLFIRILDLAPLLRWGRTFRGLEPSHRTRFLQAIERAPLLLLRRGFWGLRTLVFMGYYTQPEAMRRIGYRADRGGWSARRADGTAAEVG